MIKIDHVETYGWEASVRGMRNPMNSWDKSDSEFEYQRYNSETEDFDCFPCVKIGENDLALMKKLVHAGSDHRKFLRQIMVSMDITAPLYWWKEMDQYRIGVTTNSCSTMHRLLSRPFEMSDFSFDKLPGFRNEVKQFRPQIEDVMVANELWIAYDDDYSISNYGRVKRNFKNHYRILSGSLHDDGYLFVTIHGVQHPVHRLVAKLHLPYTYDESKVVNHKDGNKQNNFSSNLEWVTQKENIAHSLTNGLQPNAITTYNGKFTESQRLEIKSLWDEGKMSKREIAKKFGVSHTCICDIINDKYKYVAKTNVYNDVAKPVVDLLNEFRDSWILCDNEEDKKTIWYAIIQLLPSSYNQLRTVTMNYEVLLNIYRARKDHKLDEWRKFCEVIAELPYFKDFIDKGN